MRGSPRPVPGLCCCLVPPEGTVSPGSAPQAPLRPQPLTAPFSPQGSSSPSCCGLTSGERPVRKGLGTVGFAACLSCFWRAKGEGEGGSRVVCSLPGLGGGRVAIYSAEGCEGSSWKSRYKRGWWASPELCGVIEFPDGAVGSAAPPSLTSSLAPRTGQRCSAGAVMVWDRAGGAGTQEVLVDADGCPAVLAASGLPTWGSCPHSRTQLLAVAPHRKSLARCHRGAAAPLLWHSPSAVCQLSQVLPPTSCLHLLGISVPMACPAVNQHELRAGYQGQAMHPPGSWDPLAGSQH